MNGSSSETAVAIALAEYNALRAEIVSHITAQTAVVTVGVTALGLIAGFVIKEGADDQLLLVVPPLSMFVILLHTAENYRVWRLGDYIRDYLWPFLQTQAGGLPPSWEAEVLKYRSSRHIFFKAAAIDSPAIILFLASSVAALAWIRDCDDALWVAGCVMTVVAVAAPIAVALSSRSHSLR